MRAGVQNSEELEDFDGIPHDLATVKVSEPSRIRSVEYDYESCHMHEISGVHASDSADPTAASNSVEQNCRPEDSLLVRG